MIKLSRLKSESFVLINWKFYLGKSKKSIYLEKVIVAINFELSEDTLKEMIAVTQSIAQFKHNLVWLNLK